MRFFVTGKVAERKDNPPVIVQGEDDNRVARVRIYSRRKYVKEDAVEKYNYYDLTAFGKTIDWIINNCKVGTAVEVNGRIEDNNYVKQDGTKVFSKQYIIENISYCPTSSNSTTALPQQSAQAVYQAQQSVQQTQQTVYQSQPVQQAQQNVYQSQPIQQAQQNAYQNQQIQQTQQNVQQTQQNVYQSQPVQQAQQNVYQAQQQPQQTQQPAPTTTTESTGGFTNELPWK